MKYEAVTIKDIAKVLGFSTSTVSRALRDSHEISAETKRIVKEYAEKIQYRPNPIAVSLKEQRSRSIGIVVCEIANSFFSQIINGIEAVAYEKGYRVIISQSHESYEREIINVDDLSSRSIDGLLVSVSTETKNFDHLKSLYNKNLPIVFFDRVVPDINTHKVIVDNFAAAYDGTNYLVKNGFKKVANIAPSDSLYITKERVSGYEQALLNNGIRPDKSFVKYCEHGGMIYEELEAALNELFENENKPDAIFASSDKITTGCLKYFKDKKLKIPQDVGLIGFCNSHLTEVLTPALTVIKQPAFEMGRISAQLLIEMIESRKATTHFEKKVLPAELIIRESSQRSSK